MHWQEALIQWARCLLVSWTDGCLVSGEGWWEKPKSPNPVVHLPIQTHDPSWPMTSSFIQNQILWAEKEPYKHNLSHAEPHMQMTMCAHTHTDDALLYWITCIFWKDWTWPWSWRDWIMSGKSCDILITSMRSATVRCSGKMLTAYESQCIH